MPELPDVETTLCGARIAGLTHIGSVARGLATRHLASGPAMDVRSASAERHIAY